MASLSDLLNEYNPAAMARTAEDIAGGGYSGGKEDAMRHALWMAQTGQKYGPVIPQVAGAGWEALGVAKSLFNGKKNMGRVLDESWMDLKNNFQGAMIGTISPRNQSPEQLADILRKRDLSTLPKYQWK